MDTENKDQRISIEDRPEQPGDGTAKAASPATPRFTLQELRGMSVEDLRPHFKDVRGVWRTANLFEETCDDPAKYPPIYSLKDEDTSSCVSLKRLYLLMEDVTEYNFARMCLGSWEHWENITQSWALKPHIEHWRELLDIQLKAKYLQLIKNTAEESEGPNALNATKYLLEATTSHGGSKASKRGRPSKAEKEGHLKKEMRDSQTIKNDAERLGLKVV